LLSRNEVACRWLEKAEKDLRVARKILDEPDYSAFHSQQAAEKALKALLIALGKRPPRTHNIGLLLDEIEKAGLEVHDIIGAKILTDYAVEARYPNFEEVVTENEALEALRLAEKVVEWVKERLREKGVACLG